MNSTCSIRDKISSFSQRVLSLILLMMKVLLSGNRSLSHLSIYVLFLSAVLSASSFAAGLSADGKTITLNHLTIELDTAGNVIALIDPMDNTNYLMSSEQRPLISLYLNKAAAIPSSMTYAAGTYTYHFGTTVTAEISATVKGDYVVFEITSLVNTSGSDLEYFFWGPIPVNIKHSIADCLGYVYNDYYGVGMMPLNVKTVGGMPREVSEFISTQGWHPVRFTQDYAAAEPVSGGAMLRAYTADHTKEWTRDFIGPYNQYKNMPIPALDVVSFGTDGKIVGSKVALYGSDPRDLLNLVEQIELNENLAHITINGGWAKDPKNYHHVNQSDYLYSVFKTSDLQERIMDARILGADMLYGHDTFESYNGDYRFKNFSSYSNFNASISAPAAEKGIRVCTKNRTNFIHKNAPDANGTQKVNEYGTVVGETTLSQAINATETSNIQFADNSSLVKYGVLMIDDEAMTYTYASTNVTIANRGLYNTTPVSHSVNAKVKIFASIDDTILGNAHYMMNRSIPLLADGMNAAGLSLTDFDGYEGATHSGYGVFMMNKFVSEWYNQLVEKDNAMSYSSGMPHWSWHYFTGQTWGEKYNPPWDHESEFNYRTQRNGDFYRRNFFPAHMGLIEHKSTDTIEVAHWMGAKAAAFNAGLVVGNSNIPTGSTQLHDMFTAYRYWTMARDVNAFTVGQRIRMADYNTWWRLSEIEPGLEWVLEEIDKNTSATLSSEPVTTPGIKNLALDAAVTFSSNGSMNNSSEINNRSVTSTSLTAIGTGSKYVQMDLGKSSQIDQIRFWHNFYDGRIYTDVVIQLSDDPSFVNGVTTLFNNDSDNSLGLGVGTDDEYAETFTGKTLEFNTVTARYIRLWSNGNNVDTTNEYAEIQVLHGKRSFAGPYKREKYPLYNDSSNVASFSARDASSGNYRYATDDDSSTAWQSAVQDNEWIEFDLEGTFKLSNLHISWNDTNAKRYVVEASVDKHYWETVYEKTSGSSLDDYIYLPEIRCRYFRVTILGRTSDTAPVGIREFRTNKSGTADVNVALNRMPTYAATGENDPAFVTDGVSENSNNWFGLGGGGLQYIQIDFGMEFDISKIQMWKYFNRTYHDVIVQLSTTGDFSSGVSTVFNNDTDNSSGLGAGSDAEYNETVLGKEVVFAPITARYLRVYSNGSTVNGFNHWVEVKAFSTIQAARPSDYHVWAANQGLSEYAALEQADGDADGYVNLLEYAMHMNPFSAPADIETPSFNYETVTNQSYLTMSWQENQTLSGLTLTVEGSDDLISWQTATPIQAPDRVDLDNGADRVDAKFLVTGEPHYFFRIKVTP